MFPVEKQAANIINYMLSQNITIYTIQKNFLTYTFKKRMPKKCQHCRGCSAAPIQRQSLVETEYGLARVIEPSKVMVHNNEYMLKEIQVSHRKMRSMEKEIKKLKHRLRKCEQAVPRYLNDEIVKEVQYIRKSRLESLTCGTHSEQMDTVSNSQKREVGRFTHLSDRDTPKSSQIRVKSSLKSPIAPPELNKNSNSKNSALQYSQDDDIHQYFKPQQSRKSSLLLSKNFQDEESKLDKARLVHEFEELIIEEKNAPSFFEKQHLRQQISSLSSKLATLTES